MEIPNRDQLFKRVRWGHYAVMGSGNCGVGIFIRKSPALWLYRLAVFSEPNPFVLDESGAPVIFNHWEEAWHFMYRIIKYNSNYDIEFDLSGDKSIKIYKDQRPDSWYRKYWTSDSSVWPHRYNEQFYLELPTGRRQIKDHWTK